MLSFKNIFQNPQMVVTLSEVRRVRGKTLEGSSVENRNGFLGGSAKSVGSQSSSHEGWSSGSGERIISDCSSRIAVVRLSVCSQVGTGP